jgi:hypothetical protein
MTPWARSERVHHSKERKASTVSAKQKLNSVHFLGSLSLAGLIGGTSGSWPVFLIALVGLLVAGFIARDIRL